MQRKGVQADMPWYVIQTYTGGEEKLVELIRRIVPKEFYGDCFVVYHEQLRHRQQENQIHVLRLFPGYIFISSGDIEQLFRYLKTVPAMSKIMTSGDFNFTPLWNGEAEFLLRIMDEDHIVRLSYVATDGRDHVTWLSGPLERCRDQIRSYRFRKRYAVVRLSLEGQEKEAKLGIILNDDIRREIAYGKVEAAVEKPERYTVAFLDEKAKTAADKKCRRGFEVGDNILIMEGAFEGSVAIVSHIKRNALQISVQMFGREIQAEVPTEIVKRTE